MLIETLEVEVAATVDKYKGNLDEDSPCLVVRKRKGEELGG